MVTENYGECRGCGKQAILGKGLCEDCWDKQINGKYIAPVRELLAPRLTEPKISYPPPQDNFVDKLGRQWIKVENGWRVA